MAIENLPTAEYMSNVKNFGFLTFSGGIEM